MNNNRKIRVAITHGDTNGIGYELIFKAFENPEIFDLCTPIVYGSPKIAAYHHNALDSDTKFSIISDAREAQDGRLNLLATFDDDVKVGKPFIEGAKVTAKVEAQGKAKKILVFKYKAKSNYRRRQGHRQPFTKVVIEKIEG